MKGRTVMAEYWVLGDYQVTQWRYTHDTSRFEVEEWFTINHIPTEEPDQLGTAYMSLSETLLVVAALPYIGDSIEDFTEAHQMGMQFARQIGMHHWDGEEWVHRAPSEP